MSSVAYMDQGSKHFSRKLLFPMTYIRHNLTHYFHFRLQAPNLPHIFSLHKTTHYIICVKSCLIIIHTHLFHLYIEVYSKYILCRKVSTIIWFSLNYYNNCVIQNVHSFSDTNVIRICKLQYILITSNFMFFHFKKKMFFQKWENEF